MAFVVETGEALLDILDEFGKRRPSSAESFNGFVAEYPPFGEPFFEPLPHLVVGKVIGRMHPDYKMKMVGHDTKTQHVDKIETTELLGQIQQIVLLWSLKRKSGQGCAGDDVVDGRDVSADEPGYTGHVAHLAAKGLKG
jgi:hypothetical protein